MIYLKHFEILSENFESGIIVQEKSSCYNTIYPFGVFPKKGIKEFEFEPITNFYGNNGSGKTTLLNIISEKLKAIRHSEFNNSAFFERYILYCRADFENKSGNYQFLSSDDVFDHVLDIRYLNEGINYKRESLFENFDEICSQAGRDQEFRQLHGLKDYKRWKTAKDAFYKKNTKSEFVNKRLFKNIDMRSNGETSIEYFTNQIKKDALYLLDEPENSLSIKSQIYLADYIIESARFFNCQFVIATHSPIFLAIKNALIYNLDAVPVKTCKWTELENVRAYFNFFNEHRSEFT